MLDTPFYINQLWSLVTGRSLDSGIVAHLFGLYLRLLYIYIYSLRNYGSKFYRILDTIVTKIFVSFVFFLMQVMIPVYFQEGKLYSDNHFPSFLFNDASRS